MPERRHMANLQEKADRLQAEGRVHKVAGEGGESWTGVVEGDTGAYLVTVVSAAAMAATADRHVPMVRRFSCTCKWGREKEQPCAHVVAANRERRQEAPAGSEHAGA
jgi:hypothetical protein